MKKILFVFFLVLLPVCTFAGSITVTYVSDGNVTITAPGIISSPLTTTADVFKLDPLTNEAYCVDLSHYVSNNQVVNETTGNLSAWSDVTVGYPKYTQAGSAAAWLLNKYAGSGNLHKQAGLQIAIWEVLYESEKTFSDHSFGLSTGNIYFTNFGVAEVASNATFYLNDLNASLLANPNAVNGSDALWVKTANSSSTYTQDFAYVPEPSLILLLGTGLGFVSLIGYRFKAER